MPLNHTTLYTDKLETFWANARDSIKHALDHYLELETKGNKWHHHKWIILSIHHAASCVSYMLLTEVRPDHPLFKNKEFPHLEESVKALNKLGVFSSAESRLFEMFTRLNFIRNNFMHRVAPETIDDASIAFAAISMIGIIRIVAHRQNRDFYELFDEFPENRKLILNAICYKHLYEYQGLIENLLCDQFPYSQLEQCPSCGVCAVLDGHCEACFEDISEVTCQQCEAEFQVIPGFPFPQQCPQCGTDYQ